MTFSCQFYDYCITFKDEVELVWNRKTTPVTILFYVIRYLPLINNIVELIRKLPQLNNLHRSSELCF
jgi:hypothetical protein